MKIPIKKTNRKVPNSDWVIGWDYYGRKFKNLIPEVPLVRDITPVRKKDITDKYIADIFAKHGLPLPNPKLSLYERIKRKVKRNVKQR